MAETFISVVSSGSRSNNGLTLQLGRFRLDTGKDAFLSRRVRRKQISQEKKGNFCPWRTSGHG